jgi:hypothetical protein
LLGLAPSYPGEEKSPPGKKAKSHPIFTTTVDWYKPPPKHLDPNRGVRLPYQLFEAVSERLVFEAKALLGDADVIPLTTQQVTRFSSVVDPDAIIQSRIHERGEKLDFFLKHPVDESDVLKRYGKRELEEQKRRHQRIMKDLALEITRLRQLEHQLKPYLIKAVSLQAGGSFNGILVSEDLVISFGAMGSQAVPMERRPVVAFLPRKPRHVYTRVGMME